MDQLLTHLSVLYPFVKARKKGNQPELLPRILMLRLLLRFHLWKEYVTQCVGEYLQKACSQVNQFAKTGCEPTKLRHVASLNPVTPAKVISIVFLQAGSCHPVPHPWVSPRGVFMIDCSIILMVIQSRISSCSQPDIVSP